jgi:hypothetical protein
VLNKRFRNIFDESLHGISIQNRSAASAFNRTSCALWLD